MTIVRSVIACVCVAGLATAALGQEKKPAQPVKPAEAPKAAQPSTPAKPAEPAKPAAPAKPGEAPAAPGQIDMQCAGEKEERQHAPHQHPGEIHRGHHGLLVLAGRAQPEVIQADETEGDRHGDGHHADGGRQADHPVIDVGEQGGDDEAPDGDL